MGDSAGGMFSLFAPTSIQKSKLRIAALSIMASIELSSKGLPQPAGSVLISPWLDTSLQYYASGSPLVETDYVVTANTSVPQMFQMFRGLYPGDSPEVNPLRRDLSELRLLNPQLILVGGGEMALEDGKDWAKMCQNAGVKHELIIEWGQLHIYAMGSAWVGPNIRAKTDSKIINWIQQCVEREEKS
jgi:acetyl esterase/lipase